MKEPFEELVWWLQLPALIKLPKQPDRTAANAIARTVESAVAFVEASGYEPDKLIAFDRRTRKTSGREPHTEKNHGEKSRASHLPNPPEPAGTKKA